MVGPQGKAPFGSYRPGGDETLISLPGAAGAGGSEVVRFD